MFWNNAKALTSQSNVMSLIFSLNTLNKKKTKTDYKNGGIITVEEH